LTKDNTSDAVFGDSAYRSAETEATLKAQGFKSRIHVRAARGSSALEGQSGGEPEEEPPSRSRRARIWSSADLTGWPDRTDDRHRQSPGEIGLQNLVYGRSAVCHPCQGGENPAAPWSTAGPDAHS
jgi:hypothetical protein